MVTAVTNASVDISDWVRAPGAGNVHSFLHNHRNEAKINGGIRIRSFLLVIAIALVHAIRVQLHFRQRT
jgi:hypothetical protein